MRLLITSISLLPSLIFGAVQHNKALRRIEDKNISDYLALMDLIAPITIIIFMVAAWHLIHKIQNTTTQTYLATITPAACMAIYFMIRAILKSFDLWMPYLFSAISQHYVTSLLIGGTFISVPVMLLIPTKQLSNKGRQATASPSPAT